MSCVAYDEGALLQNLNLNYNYIPVDFKNPTSEDFKKFVASMKSSPTEKKWVHCEANMRVSAFIYKYRLEVLKESRDQARPDLEKIWEPFGVWKNFVSKT
ncbi:hypothetical protein OAS86_02415 [Gammaproteobacteria bacterium]|nr:hypothetical protein [Gammaproteobacteria bacterium]